MTPTPPTEPALDLEGLKAVAKAATPGPWECAGTSVSNWHDCTFEMEWIPNGDEDGINENYSADAEHIATFDPPTVLALIAKIEELQALSTPSPERAEGAPAAEVTFDPDAHELVQTAQALIMAIEKHEGWGDSMWLVTARAHASVLVQDLPDSLSPPAAEPVKMLVDADWLTRRVATDPDLDAETGSHPAPAAEPVAWRITNKATGKSRLQDQPLADLPFNRKHWLQEPLYASPPPEPVAISRDEITLGAPCTLADCPPGLFLAEAYGTLGMKSEYRTDKGAIEAYIVESGEFFWGDQPQTIERQRAQIVRPISHDAILAKMKPNLKEEGGLSRSQPCAERGPNPVLTETPRSDGGEG